MSRNEEDHLHARIAELEAQLAASRAGADREAAHRQVVNDSDARLSAIVDAAPVGIIVADAAGQMLGGNRRCEDLLGHPVLKSPTFVDAHRWVAFHRDGRRVEREEFPLFRVLAGETRAELEMLYERGAEGRRWLRFVAAPIRDAEERVSGVVVMILDVHREHTAEAALKRENIELSVHLGERTRERDRIWETTSDLMGTVGFDGMLKSVNPAWSRTLGWSDEELLSRPFADYINAADHAETVRIVDRLYRGETVRGFVDRVVQADGSNRVVMWDAMPHGALFYVVGRDVTEQTRVEEQLRQAQKMEAVGQLTGGLAHDFNNMLAGITGSLELMEVRLGQGRIKDLQRYITAAHGAAKRAAALTHRLLAFSRQQTLDPRPTDVNRLVTGMEELIRRTIGPSITLEVAAGGGLWATLVDASQLENALLNLCINARDAMPNGGHLTIETGNRWFDARVAAERDLAPGQYVSLGVSDNGSGMPPDVVKRAFDPFFTTKPIGQGTGLGLSMIYGFAKQSNGQCRIYSEIDKGTMVCLYLPRHAGAADEIAPPVAYAGTTTVGAGETVLVVDDEPTVRMLVAEVLEEMGYAAIEAADGASGLKVLQSDARIDLLITDIGLPGLMNGRQMAEAGREHRAGLKVLFMTGFAENALLSHGHLEPGMHVLTKPFAMDLLGTRIRDLIAG